MSALTLVDWRRKASPSLMSEQLSDVAAVLGRVPSGLFILTARGPEGEETGLLTSWVQQASFDPPAVSVAVNKSRYLNDWLNKSPAAAINILGETQKQYLSHFGRGFEPGEEAFAGLNLTRTSNGHPVLADCLGWLAGEVTGSVDAGDHMIYALRITESSAGPRISEEKPWVHLRKNGLGY